MYTTKSIPTFPHVDLIGLFNESYKHDLHDSLNGSIKANVGKTSDTIGGAQGTTQNLDR